jgi:hypothetical protein
MRDSGDFLAGKEDGVIIKDRLRAPTGGVVSDSLLGHKKNFGFRIADCGFPDESDRLRAPTGGVVSDSLLGHKKNCGFRISDCGLVHQVFRAETPGLPLKAYLDLKAFKLFLVDVGLLSCMVRLDQRVLLAGNELFREFKGALTEQYVLQQLRTLKGIETFFWTNDRGSAEIDFLIDTGTQVIPIEVKAETNLKAKSLKTYYEKFQPKTSIRTSMSDYKQEEWLVNLPLYAVDSLLHQLRE